jgi:hypothetical protein
MRLNPPPPPRKEPQLRRFAPIHVDLLNSWDVPESVSELRLINLPGDGKLTRKETRYPRLLPDD